MARVMEITTPLGPDILLFHAMHAREELSQVGECRIDLLCLKNDVNLDEILGKNVTVKLALPDDGVRYFNGFVTRFSQGGTYGKYRRYYATVSTWPWFLSRTADCRIFQEMTVPEIVAKIFSEHQTAMFKDDTTGKYRKWNYCVQYRETDLNFVCRLMEHEGIYFYFKHGEGQHELIMADSYSGHAPCQPTPIPFIAPEDLARPDIEHISAWTLTREIQPGVYVQDDYDFERPSVELRTQKAVVRQYSPSSYEVYDYPGYYSQRFDGETTAAVRIEEYAAQFETAQAATNAKNVAVGSLFNVEKCPRSDQDGEHLVVAATYELEYSDYEAMPDRGGAEYRCSFVAMPSKQQYRPRRLTPKPFVQGPQTAVVVGPAGDEIYTDRYGRVKVLFHWDREGEKKKDENCSCWIRVSHPWAGKGWGSVATPRIGQEVIVDFLEGDPDQPIITGRVYNAENQPPFGFPAGAVLSGYKSQTHKGAGFNELSMDDTAGKERVFIHGQYNMDTVVEHDQTTTVHNNRTDVIDVDDSETVSGNQIQHVVKDQTVNIDANRTETVGKDETITIHQNRTETVDINETINIGGNRSITVSKSETATVALQRTHSVGVNETITVGAAQEITVGGLQAITVGAVQTVNIGASQSTTVGAGQTLKVGAAQSVTVGAAQSTKVGANCTLSVGGSLEETVTGNHMENVSKSLKIQAGDDAALDIGKHLSFVAGEEIVIKTGDASIVMKKDGSILIKGKDIKIEGSGKIVAKANGEMVLKGQSKVTIN